jgi:hypothetical protein
MKIDQMSAEERKTYNWLVNETKPELKRYRCMVICGSVVVFLVVLGVIIGYWIDHTVTYVNALLVGGQLYALYGALLLALRAFSSPSTLGLMTMTRYNGNPKLFVELMKARFSAVVGVYFVVGGFFIQAAVRLVFGN